MGIRYLQGSRKRSTQEHATTLELLQRPSTWHSTTRFCKQHLNKASNYKHVLPSQLAGLAGVPLKCSTRLCSPLHIGQLCIAKTLRLLLDPPHHPLLLPARLQLGLVRTTMAAYGAGIRNAFTCPKRQCNITRDGLGNCRLSSVCLEWNRRITCKRSH